MRYTILLAFLLFFNCALVKKSKEKSTVSTDKIEKVSDSSSKETVNKKIDDTAIINVGQSNTGDRDFDEAVNRSVSNILNSLNFQKSSGDNSYKLYYDEKLQQLRAEFQLGETRNSEIEANNSVVSEKTFEENVSEYIKKIVIPWWMYLIAIILLWKHISRLILFIFPQMKGLKTLKDVITPPNKD